MADVEPERELVVRDYMPTPVGRKPRTATHILAELGDVDAVDLLDLSAFGRILGVATTMDEMEMAVSPRGYRLTAKIPRLPTAVLDRIVDHFGGLQKLLAAGIDDLQAVEGVGEMRARIIRDGLTRIAESSILERYV
jgi:diadenylate cyclase